MIQCLIYLIVVKGYFYKLREDLKYFFKNLLVLVLDCFFVLIDILFLFRDI